MLFRSMLVCFARSGDPLAMLTAQSHWGVGVMPSNLLRSIFHRDLARMVTTNPIHAWTRDPPPGFFEYLAKLNLQVAINRAAPLAIVPLSLCMVYRSTTMPLAWRLYGAVSAVFPLLTVPDDYLRNLLVNFPVFLFGAELLSRRPWLLATGVVASATCLTYYAWGFTTHLFP